MSWQDRTNPDVKLTSPEGNEFEAFWRGNDRSFSKYLGIFSIPKVTGQSVQDLGGSSDTYPITIFFEGENHDLQAESFYLSCKEIGRWDVIHPTKGALVLQLINVTEKIQSVENSNITELNIQFIEPISDEIIASVAELSSRVESLALELNEVSANQFEIKTKITLSSLAKIIETTSLKITGLVETALSPLYNSVAAINSIVNSTLRGINDTLDAPVLNVSILAAQIQTLIETPLLSTTDIEARLANYRTLADGIFEITVDNPNNAGINTLLTKELSLVAIIGSVSVISVTSELRTRSQVVSAINLILDLFDLITVNLDASQELYKDNPIDLQYFSQSESWNSSVLIISQAIAFLLKSSLDLSIEKTIILKKPRNPVEITITEYGSLGDNDENLDLFISSNNLKGNEILLLPAGKEVLIYA